MGKSVEAPVVFSDPKKVTLKYGERLVAVKIPTTSDGAYCGNGEYKVPEGIVFPLIEMGTKRGKERCFGRGHIIVQTDFNGV